jgi:hypothetical protein
MKSLQGPSQGELGSAPCKTKTAAFALCWYRPCYASPSIPPCLQKLSAPSCHLTTPCCRPTTSARSSRPWSASSASSTGIWWPQAWCRLQNPTVSPSPARVPAPAPRWLCEHAGRSLRLFSCLPHMAGWPCPSSRWSCSPLSRFNLGWRLELQLFGGSMPAWAGWLAGNTCPIAGEPCAGSAT